MCHINMTSETFGNQAMGSEDWNILCFETETTLESKIDIEQGITVGPGKFVKKNKHGVWLNVGHEQNVQVYVTKNPLSLKISVDPGKNSRI